MQDHERPVTRLPVPAPSAPPAGEGPTAGTGTPDGEVPLVVAEVAVLVSDARLRARVDGALAGAGYRSVIPRTLHGWVQSHRGHPVLVTDDEAHTRSIRRRLAGSAAGVAFVVLADDLTAQLCLELLPSSAAVLPVTADQRQIAVAVDAARLTLSCLPTPTARTLAGALAPPGDDAAVLGVHEEEWLVALADGRTVAALARSAGYSQREMYRLLSDVYGRLGATTRTEALLIADRRGLLRRRGTGTTRTAPGEERQ